MIPRFGLVGFPNVGKSTFFRYLTKAPAEIAEYPFTTIEVNKGFLNVEDEKLKKLFSLVHSKKLTFAQAEFFDVAGLIKGAHKGEGLGNQFLADIRPVEGIFEIIRNFENPNVPSPLDKIDPLEELGILNLEIILSDLQILERNQETISKEAKSGSAERKKELSELLKLKEILKSGKRPVSSEFPEILREFNLISTKPLMVVVNSQKTLDEDIKTKISRFFDPPLKNDFILSADLKLFFDLEELPESERGEFSQEDLKREIVDVCFKMLDLITFYTVNENECHSWIIKRGLNAKEAAGEVHTDFQQKFIRAEVIPIDKLLELNGNWPLAHQKGLIRVEGKDYKVQNGDVILIKI